MQIEIIAAIASILSAALAYMSQIKAARAADKATKESLKVQKLQASYLAMQAKIQEQTIMAKNKKLYLSINEDKKLEIVNTTGEDIDELVIESFIIPNGEFTIRRFSSMSVKELDIDLQRFERGGLNKVYLRWGRDGKDNYYKHHQDWSAPNASQDLDQ